MTLQDLIAVTDRGTIFTVISNHTASLLYGSDASLIDKDIRGQEVFEKIKDRIVSQISPCNDMLEIFIV